MFSIPIIIRKCEIYFLIYKPRNSDEITVIAKRVGLKKDEMQNVFNREINAKHELLLIDLACPPEFMIRKNIFTVHYIKTAKRNFFLYSISAPVCATLAAKLCEEIMKNVRYTIK